ncbi:MAG: amidohydrolase family protein [Candidatus Woesearchaeota archaeon]
MIDFHTHISGNLDLDLPERCKNDGNYSFYSSRLFRYYTQLMGLLPKNLTQEFFSIGRFDLFRSKQVMKLTRPFYGFFLKEVDRIVKQTTIDVLVKSMDASGISQSVALVIEPYLKTEDILEVSKENNRVYVFGSADLTLDNFADRVEEVIGLGIKGFKIHPAMQLLNAGDKKIYDVLEIVSTKNLPVIFDTGYFPLKEKLSTDIRDMEWIIHSFRETPIVLGHMGKDQHKDALDLAMKYDNVYLETSLQTSAVIRNAANRLGADRMLMGSDFPALKQSLAVRMVREALNDKEFYKVSHENAARLLNI